MRAITLIATAILLAACSSTHRDTRDDSTCRKYGARPGSDVYVQCRMQQQARRDQNDICVMGNGIVSCY